MVKRAIFTAITFLVMLIICLSMLCPPMRYSKYNPSGTPTKSYTLSEASAVNDAEIISDNFYNITGEDPSIVFNGVDKNTRFVAINFAIPFSESEIIQLYYDIGSGFIETSSKKSVVNEGSAVAYFELGSAGYQNIRIDIDESCRILSIDFYDTVPETISDNKSVSPMFYILSVVLSLAGAVIVLIADIYLNFFEKIFLFFKNRYKKILIGFSSVAVSLIIGAVIEFIYSLIISDSFNHYLWIFFSAIILCICIFILNFKSVEKKPENTFLALILAIGTMMILIAPIGHTSYDIDHHYPWALGASYLGDATISDADYSVININFFGGNNPQECQSVIDKMNIADKVFVQKMPMGTTVAHRLSGLFIAVARLFGANFYTKYILGQFAILLTYAIVCYFAMKVLKSGKLIVAAIALFPSNLFLATNYSYDYWVTCFSMLGIAYFISEMQQPDKPLKVRDSLIMCGALAVACLPKLIYVPLLIMPFLIRKNELTKRQKRIHYLICTVAIIGVVALFMLRSITETTGSGDVRGGDVNPSGQIQYILSDPLKFIELMWNFEKTWLFEINTYYLEAGLLGEYVMPCRTELSIFLLLFAALTDKSDCDAYKNRVLIRIFGILLFFGTFALVGASMYLAFTPLGSDYISGVQHRYITPLLFPLLIGLAPTRTMRIKQRGLYNGAILLGLSVVQFLTFGSLYLPKVANIAGFFFTK